MNVDVSFYPSSWHETTLAQLQQLSMTSIHASLRRHDLVYGHCPTSRNTAAYGRLLCAFMLRLNGSQFRVEWSAMKHTELTQHLLVKQQQGNKKLSCGRETARRTVSVKILPTAAQLYKKSHLKNLQSFNDLEGHSRSLDIRRITYIHTYRSGVHTPLNFTNGASLAWLLRRRISMVMFTSWWAWPTRWLIRPILGFWEAKFTKNGRDPALNANEPPCKIWRR